MLVQTVDRNVTRTHAAASSTARPHFPKESRRASAETHLRRGAIHALRVRTKSRWTYQNVRKAQLWQTTVRAALIRPLTHPDPAFSFAKKAKNVIQMPILHKIYVRGQFV